MLYFSRWKALATLLTALFVCLFAVPNFFSDATIKKLPTWAQRHVVLGLDLQQDMRAALQIEAEHHVALRPLGPVLHHPLGYEIGHGA